MNVPPTPVSTPDAAYFHAIYSNMFAPGTTGAIYQKVEPHFAFTLATIAGKHISIEGVPGVGKTTFLHSLAHAIECCGGHVDAREETRDDDMLHQFFADKARNAFWFQMYKLRGRQQRAQENEYDLKHGTRQFRTKTEDRDLPGDMAFAIYSHYMGYITDEQLRIYMKEATKTKYHAPFLVLYLTASPECLVERVATRGDPDEIANYTVDFFCIMDACYRAALDITGCVYCVVDWEANLPGIATSGQWHADKAKVPVAKCMQVIEQAIATTYGANIERINRMRDEKRVVIKPMSDHELRTSDPDSLVAETKRLVLKHSAGMVKDSAPVDADNDCNDDDMPALEVSDDDIPALIEADADHEMPPLVDASEILKRFIVIPDNSKAPKDGDDNDTQ